MHRIFSQLGYSIKRRLHWLSSQYWIWWSFFKNRARKLLSRLWATFAIYAVVILLFYAAFIILAYSHGKVLPPGIFEQINTMLIAMAIMSGLIIFGFGFALLLVLSFFMQGRRIADKLFKFSTPTELELFKNEVKDELASINKRLDKELIGINSRLDNIEGVLSNLVGGSNDAKTPSAPNKQKKKAREVERRNITRKQFQELVERQHNQKTSN